MEGWGQVGRGGIPALGRDFHLFTRFRDWAKADAWKRLFDAVSDGPAIEYAMSDATLVTTPPIRNGDPKNGPEFHGKICGRNS
ncbi:hypothetical protein SS37A_12490 [Methylocystis iwaonis]|uniref:Transposase n=1 Tax=Methylocystis iwaonis TaxID=2885079 RepID=A0ABM8E6Y1_9HYPH|nr:hypothetical protein SS37A_12490 [Methylocystis iwaonis]